MSETQRPKPAAQLEIPDLELVARPFPSAAGSPAAPTTDRHYSAPNLFGDDSFEPSGLRIELSQESGPDNIEFGSTIHFDATGGFDLVPPRASTDESAAWPSGRMLQTEALVIDPTDIAILADYGAPPNNPLLTPLYAYRVFVRQRELKRRLAVLNRECDRTEGERETVLADLASELRPEAERVDAFRRFFAPLVELEAALSQRGQALSAVNAELGAESAKLDTEHTRIAERVSAQKLSHAEAARVAEELALTAERAEAKLKRVQIEIRAVTHVAEQKLGPEGGQIPELEATQLATLRQRARAIQPEVTRSKADLEIAERALARAEGELRALHQSERRILRNKQLLTEHYQKELRARSAGLSESETQRRKALADLGLAVLAARGTVPVTSAWLERVQSSSNHADKLIVQRETQRRALDAYDRARVTQGVRLACTVLAVFVFLIILKIAL